MVTDWGDMGHIQHHVISHPMFAWAAACAWNPDASPVDIPAVIGELGEPLRLLGDVHTLVEPQLFNMSILTVPLYRPQAKFGHGRTTGSITIEDLDRCAAQVQDARRLAEAAAPSLERDETIATADLMALLVDDGRARKRGDGTLNHAPPGVLADFAARATALREEHGRLWDLRNRPGGLDECLANYDRLLDGYTAS
jgi:hypothetical protein